MSVTWFDLVLALVLVGVVAIEIRQGMARGLMDTLAAAAAIFLAVPFAGPVAHWIHFGVSGTAGSALAFLVLFTVCLAMGWVLSRTVGELWLNFQPDMFDPMFGAVAGIALAVIIGHTLTAGLY